MFNKEYPKSCILPIFNSNATLHIKLFCIGGDWEDKDNAEIFITLPMNGNYPHTAGPYNGFRTSIVIL